VSIEADPALGVPYDGNDLQFPWVFGNWYLFVILLTSPVFLTLLLRRRLNTQAFFLSHAWPSCTRFALLAINLVASPTFLYFFQSASLASSLFRKFRFVFILVVGSLLSPLDLCKHANSLCLRLTQLLPPIPPTHREVQSPAEELRPPVVGQVPGLQRCFCVNCTHNCLCYWFDSQAGICLQASAMGISSELANQGSHNEGRSDRRPEK
jgi:hypothetical protein